MEYVAPNQERDASHPGKGERGGNDDAKQSRKATEADEGEDTDKERGQRDELERAGQNVEEPRWQVGQDRFELGREGRAIPTTADERNQTQRQGHGRHAEPYGRHW